MVACHRSAQWLVTVRKKERAQGPASGSVSEVLAGSARTGSVAPRGARGVRSRVPGLILDRGGGTCGVPGVHSPWRKV